MHSLLLARRAGRKAYVKIELEKNQRSRKAALPGKGGPPLFAAIYDRVPVRRIKTY
jgi:hypothetical protein